MDKILAFSILSSSPAEIAGAGGYATHLSWRSGSGKQAMEKKEHEDKVERSPRPERKREVRPARFAPEFDGLNCFEYIVSSSS